MKRVFSVLRWILFTLCVAGLCCSGWQLWHIYQADREGKVLYDQMTALAVAEEEPQSALAEPDMVQPSAETNGEENTGAELPTVEIGLRVDFEALRSINPEVIGWIYGPDTGISYPVVQGSDNSYYLTHLADGTVNKNGAIFADAENSADFTDENTILYGHHMKSGAMFAALEKYREQTYYEEHPFFYLLTPEQDYQLQVVSACVVSASDELYQLRFEDADTFRLWLNRQITRSDLSIPITPDADDRIVTLSTCAYDFEDARYVVLTRMVPVRNESTDGTSGD